MNRDPFDKITLRRDLGLSKGPAQKIMRQLENATRMLEQTDIQRLMTSAAEAKNAFDAYTKSQHWAEVSGAVAQAHSVLARPETAEALRRFDLSLKNLVTAANHAIVPLAEQIHSFSLSAAQAVQPLKGYFERMEAWRTSLADRMAGLQTPWAIEDHLGVSIVGFARIARLHDISSGPAPFHPASGEIFEEELGEPVAFDEGQTAENRETARIDAGLNPELVAFPREAYSGVLYSAGFELYIEAVAPVISENGDETGRFDPKYASLLGLIENHLRKLIESELQKLKGEQWLKRRVHGDVRKKWQERKAKDHDQRGDSYPLLLYADFMDLADIISEGKNWEEVFKRFFGSKPDFQTSMWRLAPVRNAIGHNRPLVRADEITLLSEGNRILNALSIRM